MEKAADLRLREMVIWGKMCDHVESSLVPFTRKCSGGCPALAKILSNGNDAIIETAKKVTWKLPV